MVRSGDCLDSYIENRLDQMLAHRGSGDAQVGAKIRKFVDRGKKSTPVQFEMNMRKALRKLPQNVEKQVIRINTVGRNGDLRLAPCSERRYALLESAKAREQRFGIGQQSFSCLC